MLRVLELISLSAVNVLDPREQRRVEIEINAGSRIMARVQVARMQAEASEDRMPEYETLAPYEQRQHASERT